MFDFLVEQPAPLIGLYAVLIRFVLTACTTTADLLFLGRKPFVPSCVTFIPTDHYYQVLVFVFPVFGVVVWLLMSSVAHLIIRLSRKKSSFDLILNIVGIGMLVPMPFVWLWDWTMIGCNTYTMPVMAFSHTIFQIWETGIEAVGFKKILNLSTGYAIILSIIINCVFIGCGALFVR